MDHELAWAAPAAPGFLFRCTSCQGLVRITFAWHLAQGSDPRSLRLVSGPTAGPQAPRILLVDQCPRGCGVRLGLQLDPADPGTQGTVWPDKPVVLGGYRCPGCDTEGQLVIQPVVEPG